MSNSTSTECVSVGLGKHILRNPFEAVLMGISLSEPQECKTCHVETIDLTGPLTAVRLFFLLEILTMTCYHLRSAAMRAFDKERQLIII